MPSSPFTRYADGELVQAYDALFSEIERSTGRLLECLAEIDARKLYLPAGYDNLLDWCMDRGHLSEDVACKHIRVARAGREFPAIFAAVSEGRLTVSQALVLAPYLTCENVDEWLALAARTTRAELVARLAERFPRRELPAFVLEATQDGAPGSSAPGRMEFIGNSADSGPKPPESPDGPRHRSIWLSIDPETRALLAEAQELDAHVVAPGDFSLRFKRALRDHVTALRRRRRCETERPGRRRSRGDGRYIPAEVKRAVLERDGGQCTFVGTQGHRCGSRRRLEFDHVVPVARGGRSMAENLRLRCCGHNQLEAERAYGAGFMQQKREAAAQARARRGAEAMAERERRETEARAEAARKATDAAVRAAREELVPWLRSLKCTPAEARQAAALCDGMMDAPLEERLRVAIRSLTPRRAIRLLPSASDGSIGGSMSRAQT